MKVYTIEDILALNPCDRYTAGDAALLRRLVGDGLTARGLSELGISHADRIWVLTRLAPVRLVAGWALDIAQRAVTAYWTDTADMRPQAAIDAGRAALADPTAGAAAGAAAMDAARAAGDAAGAAGDAEEQRQLDDLVERMEVSDV